jgi:hypothetical protein
MLLHTFRAILLISSLISIVGCALLEPPDEEAINEKRGATHRIFKASYDEVWRAVQKTLMKFPIVVNNIDQGVLETEPVKTNAIWARPFQIKASRQKSKFTLHVNVIKGRVKKSEATRVVVLKKVVLGRDFFSDDKQLPSDGYEEDILLYRVQREITLERSLKRAFEKTQDGFQDFENFETEVVPESEIDESLNQ